MRLNDDNERMCIAVLARTEEEYAETIVYAALLRSFSKAQVCRLTNECDLPSALCSIFLINPSNEMYLQFMKIKRRGIKIVLLGALDSMWADFMGTKVSPVSSSWNQGELVVQEPSGHFGHSAWQIKYEAHELTGAIPYDTRYLARFDFTDEWNNHGYGRIGAFASDPFALANAVVCGPSSKELGWVADEQGAKVSSYSILCDSTDFSALWINRAVGPVDSLEWSLVETFLSEYRSDNLFCFPRLLEIPVGVAGICTMRLDCDQAVASARPLFEMYQQEKIPFSLAILTGLSMDAADEKLIQDVIRNGGGILSHSVNHLPDWGGNYDVALQEALESKQWLMENYSTCGSAYLVSPFHQNPRYAVKALLDAGYAGFVGGIIHNDPEYLFARSGAVPYHEEDDFFSLSQQCMLHGDCFHQYGNSIYPYLEALRYQMGNEGIFGFLDHPFSSEYQYGWLDEEERLKAHYELIQQMKAYSGVKFCNLNETMEFCRKRSQTTIWINSNGQLCFRLPASVLNTEFTIQADWKKKRYSLG